MVLSAPARVGLKRLRLDRRLFCVSTAYKERKSDSLSVSNSVSLEY